MGTHGLITPKVSCKQHPTAVLVTHLAQDCQIQFSPALNGKCEPYVIIHMGIDDG